MLIIVREKQEIRKGSCAACIFQTSVRTLIAVSWCIFS